MSSSNILRANKRYRWVVLLMFGGMVLLGFVFLQLTDVYIQELQQLSEHSPEQALNKTGFLLILISMLAGFPLIGIGTYVAYQGNQIRIVQQFPRPGSQVIVDTPIIEGTPAWMRGWILIVCGGGLVVSGFVLPIIAWWITEGL